MVFARPPKLGLSARRIQMEPLDMVEGVGSSGSEVLGLNPRAECRVGCQSQGCDFMWASP